MMLKRMWIILLCCLFSMQGFAEEKQRQEYLLGPSDVVRINVYNNPDLTTESRVQASGAITFPLLGEVRVSGNSVAEAEKKIASLLERGGYIKDPQVTITVMQFQSQAISVLGDVAKPGRYNLDQSMTLSEVLALAGGSNGNGSEIISVIREKEGKTIKQDYDMRNLFKNADKSTNPVINAGDIVYINSREVSILGQVGRPGKYSIIGNVRTITDFLSQAGGITPGGDDKIIVITNHDGKQVKKEIDVDLLYKDADLSVNVELANGDSIYVPRYPVFYIYGEVQRPGSYRLERNMTLTQALSTGGGLSPRGTESGIRIKRRNASGVIETIKSNENDTVQANDVIYVRESWF